MSLARPRGRADLANRLIKACTTTVFRYDGGTNFQELKEDENGWHVTTAHSRRRLGGGIGSILYSDRMMAPTQSKGKASSTTPSGIRSC